MGESEIRTGHLAWEKLWDLFFSRFCNTVETQLRAEVTHTAAEAWSHARKPLPLIRNQSVFVVRPASSFITAPTEPPGFRVGKAKVKTVTRAACRCVKSSQGSETFDSINGAVADRSRNGCSALMWANCPCQSLCMQICWGDQVRVWEWQDMWLALGRRDNYRQNC